MYPGHLSKDIVLLNRQLAAIVIIIQYTHQVSIAISYVAKELD